MRGFMEAWMRGSMDAWMRGPMEAWMHGCKDAWKHGCVEAWMHGYMDPWTRGRMGSESHERIDSHECLPPFSGLGIFRKIMEFNKISQNLQRAVRPVGVSTPSVRGLHCGAIFELLCTASEEVNGQNH